MSASFFRAFAPTETDPERLGLQPLATGRKVYRTGKVDIGIAHQPPPPRDIGVHAERVQTVLLDADERKFRGAMRPDPNLRLRGPLARPVSLWQRILETMKGTR